MSTSSGVSRQLCTVRLLPRSQWVDSTALSAPTDDEIEETGNEAGEEEEEEGSEGNELFQTDGSAFQPGKSTSSGPAAGEVLSYPSGWSEGCA